jgi:nucleotide-binding universal stress UspA family protein
MTESGLFNRIVCGVDGTPASDPALHQALRLIAAEGSLVLLAVTNVADAAHAGIAAAHAAGLLQHEAEAVLEKAKAIAPSAHWKLVHADPATALLREADDATLVCIGSHGRSRAAGLLLGTVAARMLHEGHCSVLIARDAPSPEKWPQTIVAGVDGSEGSATALAAARSLADHFGSRFRAIASTEHGLDINRARELAPELEEDERDVLATLRAASDSADLLVLGSRGLHGVKALGSVSERAAHQARSSVLVVRPGPQQVATVEEVPGLKVKRRGYFPFPSHTTS